ncbi:MAG TPA: mevalonate kinase [Anaerolineae bacterium]|nr:mevalonate kinase [Anaerolineae bacterium]
MSGYQAVAPGKIILFGEHAVVYGRPAIAVPVSNVQATARLEPATTAGLRLVAPDLKRDYYLGDDVAPDDALARIIRLTLARLGQPAPPDAVLTVTSTIPLGRGLGSGAAISTAICRVLAQFYEQTLSPAEVSSLVYEVEKLYHGTPSGIDNTVIAYEQPVYFVKGQPIEPMAAAKPFTLVVGDTGIVAPTHQVVGDLRRRWEIEPARYEIYFDHIAAIAVQARLLIEQGETGPELGRLMNANQALLETVGVSSPALEQLSAAARQAGALGAKLSGAGWGGNMIALVEPQPDAVGRVTAALEVAGATGIIVTEVAPP